MCLKLTPTILPQWIYKRLQLVYTVSQLEEEVRLCYFRHPASLWCQGKFNANAQNRDQQVFARVGRPVDLYFVVKVRLGCIECISRARVLRPDQTRMRVDESRNSRSRLTANSHQLWAGSNFEESQWEVWLVWPVMRVAWDKRFALCSYMVQLHGLNKMADVS